MDIFDNCRICLHEINHEPIKMTRLIIKFLEKSLQLINVTKPNQDDVKQNLCAPCFNKLSGFQDFHEQCRDSDEFWKVQFDNFKVTTLEEQLIFEQSVTLDDNCNSLEADTATIEQQFVQEHELQSVQSIPDDMAVEDQVKQNFILPTSLIYEEEETAQIDNDSIDLTNWPEESNDNDNVEPTLLTKDNGVNVTEEIIEYEYKIDEDEIKIEEISVTDEAGCSGSFEVDYQSFSYEKLKENSNDASIIQESIEDILEEQSEVTQKALFMTTSIDENGKMKMSYKCHHCDKSFNRVHDIESHYNIHKGVKPFTCNVCGKSFRQKNILTTHQALHFGKKVECDECGKKFARRSQLILHYRMHRDEKPFECDFEGCKTAFRQRKQLIDHSFIHTGEKNFQCTTCTKSFHTRKRLQDHIYKVHSQYRYCCNLCEKAFLKPHMLKHHMISAHNVEVDDVSHLKALVDNLKTYKKFPKNT